MTRKPATSTFTIPGAYRSANWRDYLNDLTWVRLNATRGPNGSRMFPALVLDQPRDEPSPRPPRQRYICVDGHGNLHIFFFLGDIGYGSGGLSEETATALANVRDEGGCTPLVVTYLEPPGPFSNEWRNIMAV